MRPSFAFFLLLFCLILHDAQGIRLEKGILQVDQHRNVNEEKGPLTETRNIGGINGEVILCKEGHCTGMNRKLATVTTAISTATSKTEKNGESRANPKSKGGLKNGGTGGKHEEVTINHSQTSGHQEINQDRYVDIMDYTPAKRKSPIHN